MTSDRDSSNERSDESGDHDGSGDRDGSDDGDGSPDQDVADSQELEARIDALESTLRELRRESLRPPRGPFGLPRPPTPREFVEFTDRHAIPATIAFLEAHIRALQALQAALRLVRGADDTRERTAEARTRTVQLGRRTLDALDSALDDLGDVIEEGRLPENADARSVLVDAQRLTDEIRTELDATGTRGRAQSTGPSPDAESTALDTHGARSRGEETRDPRVDPEEVETELDVLRDEVGGAEPDDNADDRTDDSADDDADADGSTDADGDEDGAEDSD